MVNVISQLKLHFDRLKLRARAKPKRYLFGAFVLWFLLNSFAVFGEGRLFGGSGRVMDITDGVAKPVEGAYVLIGYLSTSINLRYPGPKCDKAVLARTDANGVYRTKGVGVPEQWPSFSTETNLGTPRIAVYAKDHVTLFTLFQLPPRTEKLRAGISMPADLPQTVAERKEQLARFAQYRKYLINPENVDAFYLKADVPGLRDSDVVVVRDERLLGDRVASVEWFPRTCETSLPEADSKQLGQQQAKDVLQFAIATGQAEELKRMVLNPRATDKGSGGAALRALIKQELGQ